MEDRLVGFSPWYQKQPGNVSASFLGGKCKIPLSLT